MRKGIVFCLATLSIIINGCSLYMMKKYGTYPYSYDGGKYELPNEDKNEQDSQRKNKAVD